MVRLAGIILIVATLFGCSGNNSGKTRVIVFHAGSLSVPLKQMEKRYEELHPGVDIQLEGAGSVACARKITELNRECDILASADYMVIENMLIPDYTDYNFKFATNSIVLAFTDRSARSDEISIDNWVDILLDKEVIYGRSDPDSDPCGYRSIMTMKLAGNYYGRVDIASRLIEKDMNMIRPKAVDLVALLQTGVLDYFFTYKSVGIQHGLNYIELPPEINLSDPALSDLYGSVSVDIVGSKPGEYVTMTGEVMVYGVTLLNNAPQREEAIRFLDFFLGSEGREIISANGQAPLDLPDNPLMGLSN